MGSKTAVEEGQVFEIVLMRGPGFGLMDKPVFEPGTLEEHKGVCVRWFEEGEHSPRFVYADVLDVIDCPSTMGQERDRYTLRTRVPVGQIPHGATVEPAGQVSPLEALTLSLFETEAGQEVLTDLELWFGFSVFPASDGGLEFVPADVLSEEKVALRDVL